MIDTYTYMNTYGQEIIRDRIGLSPSVHHSHGMNVPELIRMIMAKTGWKQSVVAEHVGVSQATVSRWLAGSPVLHDHALAVQKLARETGILTNETRTSTMALAVPIAGSLDMNEQIEWHHETEGRPTADLPFPLPDGCFAIEILGNGGTARAVRGDLIVAGPFTDDVDSLTGREAVLELGIGVYIFGTPIRGRDEKHFNVLGMRGLIFQDVAIERGGAYCATIAAGLWKRHS